MTDFRDLHIFDRSISLKLDVHFIDFETLVRFLRPELPVLTHLHVEDLCFDPSNAVPCFPHCPEMHTMTRSNYTESVPSGFAQGCRQHYNPDLSQ